MSCLCSERRAQTSFRSVLLHLPEWKVRADVTSNNDAVLVRGVGMLSLVHWLRLLPGLMCTASLPVARLLREDAGFDQW
jgi:hypothetical protein